MNTYGFRGEALSSISHVSHVTITTKTEDQMCGFKLEFIDGKPKSSPTPIASNTGTTISVENLFYNLLLRKNALSSYSNEYNLIVDVVTKYAIHNSNTVSFSLKKFGESNCDLNTIIGSQTLDNIRTIYGTNIAKDLIALSLSDENRLKFSMSGFISNTNTSLKNLNFILFINNRLVDCSSLKKAIDMIYSNHLMKGFHPFVYLSLKIDVKNIDVNVHPTKSEVHFLHEEEICQKIVELIENKLSNGETRTLSAQNVLPNSSFSEKYNSFAVEKHISDNPKQTSNRVESNNYISKTTNSSENVCERIPKIPKEVKKQNTTPRPHKQIRTDSRDRKIDEFLSRSKKCETNRREIRLTSVLELRKSVAENCDNSLQDLICKSSYVGCADEKYILFQHNTQLMLVNGLNLNQELFYQLFLIDFGNFAKFKLSNPLPIRELAKIYLDFKNESNNEEIDIISAPEVEEILMNKKEMLSDYFSITINESNQLTTLPIILDGFVPNLSYLPKFIYCLAKDVNWSTEKECFESIGRVLSQFFANPPNKFECDKDHEKWAKTVELIIYPSYKSILCPSKKLANNFTFHVTANLSDLYKVFERC